MRKMKELKKNNKGFTLVELIIVVAIIAMLIAMIAPNLTSFLGTASSTTLKANAKTAYTSVNAWLTQQRVDGVTVEAFTSSNPLVIYYDGTNNKLAVRAGSVAPGTTVDAKYNGLTNMFNAGEFKAGTTEIHIESTATYTVTKITWVEGTESAVYPE